MKLKDMNENEKSLLLYFETRNVDHGGLIDTQHMNEADDEIAKGWNESGFITSGRLTIDSINEIGRRGITMWCKLSKEAFKVAHQERIARANRMMSKRRWQSTKEKREG